MMEIFLDEVNKSIEGEFDIYFKYIEKIASGSFGIVYRAIYLEQNREVAVKVIDKTQYKFNNLNRLKLEINILKQLKHKNILEFINCIETNSKMYIITEYVKDGTLKELINNRSKSGNYYIYILINKF
jgi:serine/threonine protein kinase